MFKWKMPMMRFKKPVGNIIRWITLGNMPPRDKAPLQWRSVSGHCVSELTLPDGTAHFVFGVFKSKWPGLRRLNRDVPGGGAVIAALRDAGPPACPKLGEPPARAKDLLDAE